MDDCYLTPGQPARIETKVKGSRFIAEIKEAHTIQEANNLLEAVRKREHAATHHCFAWRVGVGVEPEFKYSDDGEPSGTAGRPIYDAIVGRALTNVILIVTRYYGGTKLGTGGLVRAYSEAARQTLEESGSAENFITRTARITIDFTHYDSAQRLIQKLHVLQESSDFAQRVTLKLKIRQSLTEKFIQELAELTGGKAEIELS